MKKKPTQDSGRKDKKTAPQEDAPNLDDLISCKLDESIIELIDPDILRPTDEVEADGQRIAGRFAVPMDPFFRLQAMLRHELKHQVALEGLSKDKLQQVFEGIDKLLFQAYLAGHFHGLGTLRMNKKAAGRFLNKSGKKETVVGSYTRAAMAYRDDLSWQENYNAAVVAGHVSKDSRTGMPPTFDAFRRGVERELKRKRRTGH